MIPTVAKLDMEIAAVRYPLSFLHFPVETSLHFGNDVILLLLSVLLPTGALQCKYETEMPETVGKLDQILMIMSYYHLDNPHPQTTMFVWVNFVDRQHSLNLQQFFPAQL